MGLRRILAVLLCGAALVLTACHCSQIEPCSVLTIRSRLEFYDVIVSSVRCCDQWCTGMCNYNRTVTHNRTVYYQERQCCPGYDGIACLPVCSYDCGVNQECSQPEQCTCSSGWTGQNCQKVDGFSQLNVTSSSVQLSWLLPDNDNDNGYYLFCANDSHHLDTTVENGQNISVISGLGPFIHYKCCIVPILIAGNGTELCLPVTTLQSAPSTAPRDVTVQNTQLSYSVLIKWQPPLTPNGIITHYTLTFYYNNSTAPQANRTIDSQFNMYLLDGIPPSTKTIGVSLSASTDEGMGPQSVPVTTRIQFTNETGVHTPSVDGSQSMLTTTHVPQSSSLNLIWTPPISLQASYYHLILYEPAGVYQQWTLSSLQILNLTVPLEPYIPYILNATAVTVSGEVGVISSNVFFLRENVPQSSPNITLISRVHPNSGLIKWTTPSLTQSRGVVTNYTLLYSESTSNSSCGNINTNNVQSIVTANTTVWLTDLISQKAYCISLLASTQIGMGPQSERQLLPTYESSKFCIVLDGVYNCSKWILDDLSNKLNNLTAVLVNLINNQCSSCQLTTQHIVHMERVLSCSNQSNSQAMFCGQLIGTDIVSSSQLIDQLSRNREPAIISGLSLRIINVCKNKCTILSGIGDINGITHYHVATLILAVALSISVILQLFTCVLLINYCNKYYKTLKGHESRDPSLSMYYSSSNGSGTSSESVPSDLYLSPKLTTV